MKTILELEINQSQKAIVFDFLESLKINFRSSIIQEKETSFEMSEATVHEIRDSVDSCFGIWKNRADLEEFSDLRSKAWSNRGIK